MTHSDFAEMLAAKNQHLSFADTKLATNIILDAMTSALASGHRIEIRGFGIFSLNYRPSRVGRHPRTGVAIHVPAKAAAHFKMGKEMKARVDRTESPGKATEILRKAA